ncbi:MAG: hypothetical protein AAF673_01595 [Pseudomonadota bacterium]
MRKLIYLQELKKVILLVWICSSLASCAIYSSGFNCSDSRGARCMMLSDVDALVDSGEIETIYQNKKCKKGKCKNHCKHGCNNDVPRVDDMAENVAELTKYYINSKQE